MGNDVRFSPDGLTWTHVELPVDDGFVSGSFAFDGGVILLVSDFRGDAEIFRVDETGGSPVRLDLPGLPANLRSGYSASSREVLVLDASEPPPPPPPLVVEHDGHRLTFDNEDLSIEIVDLATGDVVGETDFRGFGPDLEGNVVIDEEGLTLTDPETGEVIVAFPTDVLEAASEDQGPDTEFEHSPDFWLLASSDGERFLLVDLDDDSTDNAHMIGAVAGNGTTVLVQVDDEWVVYDLP